ncbi:MAG: aldehyde ferredoxin oxidoreductase family protein [Chloroflexi bacterium]|nr:aldehyde ferredoxin oxidoreductase family protein [Chloroflexota bacterium]
MLTRKIAYVDLSPDVSGRTETVPPEWRRRYVGARGVNMHLLYSRYPPVDPLSPDNPLIFGCGLLTGLPGFGSGRMNVTAYSPASGNLGDSNVGGHFGPELRFAGYDHLVITGQSPRPVYLLIQDDRIEIRDASRLWGQTTLETQQMLRHELNDDRLRVLTIGPAGERLVRMASIITGPKDAAGRFGMGAVMGSKNLKAVAVRGSQDLTVAHPRELLDYGREQLDALWRRKWVQALGRQGTPLLIAPANEGGWLLTRNDQAGPLGERGRSMYAESLEPYSLGMASCFGCTVHCRHRHEIKGGPRGEGPEYSVFGWGAANLDVPDTEFVIRANDLVNAYGMDVMDTLVMIGFAFELYQRGIISRSTAGGPLEWGDGETALALIHQIARREGIGDILAEGSYALAKLPREAGPYLLRVKNAIVGPAPGGRVVKSFALGHSVATIGGHLHRNRPGIDVLGLPPQVLADLYEGPASSDYRSYEGKARMVWWHELLYAVCDSLGFCRFQTVFNSPHAPQYPQYQRLIQLALDWDMSVEELREAGERIYTTERLLLGRLGVGTREHDTLPQRWLEEPVAGGPCQGEVIDQAQLDRFLDQYYALHGWDNNGQPRPDTVKALGIA